MWNALVNYFNPQHDEESTNESHQPECSNEEEITINEEMDVPIENNWDVPELDLEHYSESEAWHRLCISWLLSKAYSQDDLPDDLKEPFSKNPSASLSVKPLLAGLMVSGEVYLRVCTNIFHQWTPSQSGHWAVIEALSKRGLYVVGRDESAVTETDLKQTTPFLMPSHMALTETLMEAHTKEVITIERIVQAVRRFATFNASSELPYDLEDALLFWMNKVCATVRHRLDREAKAQQQNLMQNHSPQKVRINKKQLAAKEGPFIPVMDDLLKDLSDCCCLAILVNFYCPQCIRFADIVLKKTMGFADSCYNFKLIKTFCGTFLPTKCFHFQFEDFVNGQSFLKPSVLTFLSELFYYFEVSKLDIVETRHSKETSFKPPLSKTVPTGSPVPISNATKRSFQQASGTPRHEAEAMTTPGSPSIAARQPLLQKRQQNQRDPQDGSSFSVENEVVNSGSIGHPPHELHRKTSLDRRDDPSGTGPMSNPTGQLLSNVQIDPELNESVDTDCISSMDIEMLRSGDDREAQPTEALRLESVSSFNSARTNVSHHGNDSLEPLIPAVTRPAKEKSNNHSKEFERGDLRKDTSKSSQMIVSANKNGVLTSQQRSSDSDTLTNVSQDLPPGVDLSIINSSVVPESSRVFMPVESGEFSASQAHTSQSKPVAESFTIPEHPHSPNSARAAGIPIVDNTELDKPYANQSAFEHIESNKIHADQNGREVDKARDASPSPKMIQDTHRPDSLIVPKPVVLEKDTGILPFVGLKMGTDLKPSPTTGFAEIKRWRDSIGRSDNSGFVYVQHGDNRDNNNKENKDRPEKISLRQEFQRKKKQPEKSKKTTSFAAPPNQTTWQESAEKSSKLRDTNAHMDDGSEVVPALVSEIASVRMLLEQKRRAMELEKRRVEAQMNKQRQRVGKAVFMHVLSKSSPEEKQKQRKKDSGADGLSRPSSTPLQLASHSEVKMSKPSSLHNVAKASPPPEQSCFRQPLSRASPELAATFGAASMGSTRESPPLGRPLSRQYIQETIETVKQKWLANEPLVVQTHESRMEQQPRSEGASPRSVGSGSDDYDEYNQSLEKLNHSLSELQSEIMRLSLQQEQIKTLATDPARAGINMAASPGVVGGGVSTAVSPKPTGPIVNHTPTGPVVQRRTPTRQIYQRQLSADNAIPPPVSPMHLLEQNQGAIRIHNPALAEQAMVTSDPLHSELRRSDQPFILHQGSDGSAPFDMARSSFSDSGLYVSSGHHRDTMGFRGYSQTPGASYMNQSPSVLQSPPALHPYGITSPPTSSPRLQDQTPEVRAGLLMPSPSFQPHHPQHMGSTYGQATYITSGQTQLPATTGYYIPSPSEISSHYQNPSSSHHSFVPVSELGTTRTTPGPSVPLPLPELEGDGYDDARQGPSAINGLDNMADISENSTTADSQAHHSADDRPLKAGFFVSFGEDTPVKAVRSKTKRKSWEKPTSAKALEEEDSGESAFKKKEKLVHSPVRCKRFVPPASGDSPAKPDNVGFVIGVDDATLDASTEMDIQKKREKLMLQQMKRREEMEKKRLKKEADAAQKRDDQRMKQLEAEQKKAEDKLRRDAIYQQYLNRKAEDEDNSPRQQKPRSRSSKQKSSSNNGVDKVGRPESYPSAGRSADRHDKDNGNSSQASLDSGQISSGSLTHRAGSPSENRPQLTSRKESALTNLLDSGSDAGSSSSDYLGPKLFVKPSSKSNRHIIINAISHCCLAGCVNDDLKAKVLEEIAKSDEKHFVILFRDRGQKYRALYSFCPDRDEVLKIHGTGPKQITNKMIERYFKYNSGGKSFAEVESTKHLSVSIDAITIKDSLWAKKPVATKKPGGSHR